MTEFPQTQSSLIAQLRSPADREAWERFVLLYRPVLYRMARRRGMQDADAQDLAQTVLVRVAGAIERWEKTDPNIKFRHWLRRVAANAMATAFARRPHDLPAGGSATLDQLSELPADSTELEDELARECMRERYLRAASQVRADVDPETWRAFELSVVSGVDCRAVAVQTGKSIGSVYAARSRVMRRLRDLISHLEEESE